MSLPSRGRTEILRVRPSLLAGFWRYPDRSGAAVRPGVRVGIDLGSVRIGVARSDPDGRLASPLETIRRGTGDLAELARRAADTCP